jgi:hypothetical protein
MNTTAANMNSAMSTASTVLPGWPGVLPEIQEPRHAVTAAEVGDVLAPGGDERGQCDDGVDGAEGFA